jgi:hypothetical protein
MTEKSAKETIAEIEARRATRKAETETARDEQYVKDVAIVDKLEEEHGCDRVAVLKTPSFVTGLPTVVVVRTPEKSKFNRFRDMVRKANQSQEAIGAAKDLLAASCILYPEPEVYERMKESWPSIHDSAGVEAIRLGETEGKG